MKLHFDFDVAQFLSDIGILNLEEKLPEFVAKTLSVSFRDKIESRIREKIGSGGDELLAEYKSFVADLALREHGKVEKIDKFFEPHLKNAGFSGNFTIRDVFDRKSKVSKWMKTRKK